METSFQLRDPVSYDHQCSCLEGDLGVYDSVTYGINCRSPLNRIRGFHVANNQLPQDIMHVILEGVLPLEVKLMLTFFIKHKKYFSIDCLNDRISNFIYGRSEAKNKPPKKFTTKTFSEEGKLRLSGMRAWSVF